VSTYTIAPPIPAGVREPSSLPGLPPPDALIGVLTGGRSRERDRSLLSGHTAAAALTALGYQVRIIDTADPSFRRAVQQVDVAFLAIAGRWAEDGKLQGYLDTTGVPYTGSGVLASALAMHKPAAKIIVHAAGVPVLPHHRIDPTADAEVEARQILSRLGAPVIVKPESEGGSIDIAVAHDPAELAQLLTALRGPDQPLFAEPFVRGQAVTVGVLETAGELVSLPVLATSASDGEFYDYAAKRDSTRHSYQCPADLPPETAAACAHAARHAHRALGCSGYSRSDLVIDHNGQVFWLETNTLPGLSHAGNLATMAGAAGITYDQLVARILTTTTTGSYRP
jgi:D-alanine-D-alanine ligase